MREIQGSIKSQLDECATNNREYLSIQNFVGKIDLLYLRLESLEVKIADE